MRRLTSIEVVVVLAALALSWTFQAAIFTWSHSTADKVEMEELPYPPEVVASCPALASQMAQGGTALESGKMGSAQQDGRRCVAV